MKIADKIYFDQYHSLIGKDLENFINKFDFDEQNGDLGYQTQASAVYSSNIEGNTIDLNSFMNLSFSKEKFRPTKEVKEIEDLISAYELAQQTPISEMAFLKCHKLLAKQLVIPSLRGKYRNDKVGVFGQSGLVYLAVEETFVAKHMNELFEAINDFVKSKLTLEEVFYFASLIHLRFVHIHPFRDGNGRAGRLLEKWFLAEKLGRDFWKIPSEKYYKEHQSEYYKNIDLGINFYELNYDNCLPFLMMLPECLK